MCLRGDPRACLRAGDVIALGIWALENNACPGRDPASGRDRRNPQSDFTPIQSYDLPSSQDLRTTIMPICIASADRRRWTNSNG